MKGNRKRIVILWWLAAGLVACTEQPQTATGIKSDVLNKSVGDVNAKSPPVGFGTYSDRRDNEKEGWALQIANNVEPANGNPLLDVPTFFGSPHIGATTRESWGAMLRSGMRGIKDAYEPEPGVYPFD